MRTTVIVRIAAAALVNILALSCTDRAGTGVSEADPPEANLAIQFDGESTWIEIPRISDQQPKMITLEMLVRLDSAEMSVMPLVAWEDADGEVVRGGFRLTCEGGGLRFRVYTAPDEYVDARPTLMYGPGQWNHVAFTYYYGSVRAYINGIFMAQNVVNIMQLPLPHYDGDRLVIGGAAMGETGERQYFKGQVDEIRLWSTTRTPEQIERMQTRRSMDVVTGLVGYWNFDGDADTSDIARDRSMTQNHGRIHGRVSRVLSTAFER